MEKEDLIEDIAKGLKSNIPDLELDSIKGIAQYFNIEKVKKNEDYIKKGRYNGKFIVVIKGLFKAYYRQDDQELIMWFRNEHTLFASHHSIFDNGVSSLSYKALENSTIATIEYSHLKKLSEENNTISKSIIIILEHLMLQLIKRVEEYGTVPPSERYIKFLIDSTAYYDRLSQKEIAAYLGITPESFSRMKNRMR